ncbi:protein adenylyltransferase SelO [Geomicrobium sediminis]|uniref:Protein nucleotidyltransferase YdiU n=1 Tax=Geomicrobium sediminis TaxID=1347788 RepID=A0ABS2PBB2_9BACL|nr:YdiU family protein [Geomicrobium sediminis]MBM7632431.1 uncharacterized protein YdiU (UPF0061 family) [Geomicrobium sediminis]
MWKFDHSYLQLPETFYSKVEETPVQSPKMFMWNDELAKEIGLDDLHEQEKVDVFSGSELPESSAKIAQAYAGHQFGNFTMLGDGRALLIGEQQKPNGERVDIQLKGSGRTPYSRSGDGRAALKPMLREYVISEAMHGLGVPTTRSLAVVTTGELVHRETALQGAILTRVASSHLRVGTFEYARALKDDSMLKDLADYAIQRHTPQFQSADNRYAYFLDEVIKRQAKLVSQWQLVGFIHGVMNTDNMTISGETIDYGPCAFMDTYDPRTVFSSIDQDARYAYSNQPYMANWNLARLAEALVPLLSDSQQEGVEIAQEAIGRFKDLYQIEMIQGMRSKLGLMSEESGDGELIGELLSQMEQRKTDFTNTFRALTLREWAETGLYGTKRFDDWLENYEARLSRQEATKEEVMSQMKRVNPAIIPRNHIVEDVLRHANQGDSSHLIQFVEALKDPYSYSSDHDSYTKPPEGHQPYTTYCGT